MKIKNLFENDEYDLYIHAPDYLYIRDKWKEQTNCMFECELAQKRLEKIPK
jgi:hypothetical protein